MAVVITLLGWLRDSRREYVAAEAADRTGHLDLGGAPSWPKATFAALAIIVVAALVLTAGIVPDSARDRRRRSGAPGGSGAPAAAGGSGGTAAAGAEPAGGRRHADGAENIALRRDQSLTAPAGKAFTLAFDNQDAGVPHDLVIKDAGGRGRVQGRYRDRADGRRLQGPRPCRRAVHRSSARSTRT